MKVLAQLVNTLKNVLALFIPLPFHTGNMKTVDGKEVPETKWVFSIAIGEGKYGMPLGWVMIIVALLVKWL